MMLVLHQNLLDPVLSGDSKADVLLFLRVWSKLRMDPDQGMTLDYSDFNFVYGEYEDSPDRFQTGLVFRRSDETSYMSCYYAFLKRGKALFIRMCSGYYYLKCRPATVEERINYLLEESG